MSTTQVPEAELLKLGYEPSLNRQLGFGSLLVYGLLFFVPLAPVAVYGIVVNRSGGVPVLVYLLAAVVMGLSAVSYREMALRFPVAGSVYGYVRLATNPGLGFIAGWLILLDYALMPGLLTVLASVALGHILPQVPSAIFAVLLVGASLALNLWGLKLTTRIGLVLLAIQVAVLGAFGYFVIAALARGEITLQWTSVVNPSLNWAGVISAVTIAALSYLGFDAVATLNEEAKGGGRAVGWATMVLLGLVTAIFVLQVFAVSLVAQATSFPPGSGTERAFYHAVDAVAPAWFTPVFTLTNAFVAIFACLVVAHAASSRLVFAMARDGVLPRKLSATSARGVPHRAVLLVGGVSLVLGVAFAGRAELMTSLVTFGALGSYVMLHLAVLRHCLPTSRDWLRHLVVPGLGIVCLVIALSRTQDLARTIGVSWLVAGAIGYLLVAWWLKRKKEQ